MSSAPNTPRPHLSSASKKTDDVRWLRGVERMTALNGAIGNEILSLLTQLISFPTESRTSNTKLIDFYADRAASLGGSAHIVTGVTGPERRANLHLRFGPDVEGGVLFSGHTDVVPAGSGWNTDPYRLTADGDQLFGRGTADMKGFLAVALAALTAVDTRQLVRPVHLALSYDEEIGCVGVHSLLAHLGSLDHCRPDIIVVGEPTQMELCTAHSGKRVFRVEVIAPSGHSSRSPEQPTAIEAGAAIITAVVKINRASGQQGNAFSTNVGTISGGVAVNVLSPSCELDFECRHQWAVDPAELLKPVFETADEWWRALQAVGGDLTVSEVVSYPALSTSRDHKAVTALRSALDDPAMGEVAFGCEAGLYAQTLPAPAVIFGPGNIADAHRPDEYVRATDLQIASDRLLSTIDSFCRTRLDIRA